VEPDDPRSLAGFEVAAYRIPNLVAQVGDAVRIALFAPGGSERRRAGRSLTALGMPG
jgi:hypothetical protein